MIRRVENAPGYVLHTRPWRETSLVVEAFTGEHGRLGLVARGVRQSRSRFRGLLLPFRLLLLSWSGRGELPTLTGADTEGPVRALRGRALFSGFYLNELLLKLLPRNDAHPELFEDYGRAIDELGGSGILDGVLRTFEKGLLDALGYGPTLDRAADTGDPIFPDRRYRYVPERGPVESSDADEGPVVSGTDRCSPWPAGVSTAKTTASGRRRGASCEPFSRPISARARSAAASCSAASRRPTRKAGRNHIER